jgi:hypothetical protein
MWYVNVLISTAIGVYKAIGLSEKVVAFIEEKGAELQSSEPSFGLRDLRFEVGTEEEAKGIEQAARKFLAERLHEDDFATSHWKVVLGPKDLTGLRCPDCGREDDFLLMGKGAFTIRRRTGKPEEFVKLDGQYQIGKCKCNVCEYTGSYDLFTFNWKTFRENQQGR